MAILTQAWAAPVGGKPLSEPELKKARELYASQGCVACHQIPHLTKAAKLEEVSKKYAALDKGLQMIKASLASGSTGKWGTAEMPPQTHVQEADRDLLARWILGLHKSGEKLPEIPVEGATNGAPTPAVPAEFIEKRSGSIIQALDRPVVYSTYLPDAPSRAIAVGLPGDVSFGFDAQNCRLLYAWRGGFLDVTKSWVGFGGWYSKLIGQKFHVAPSGFPLRVGNAQKEPNVQFKGYHLVDGYPVFNYLIDGIPVRHRIEINQAGKDGLTVQQEFHLQGNKKPVFFHAGADGGTSHQSDDADWKNGRWKVRADKLEKFSISTKVTR